MKQALRLLVFILCLAVSNISIAQVTIIGPLTGGNFDLAGGMAGNSWAATSNISPTVNDGWVINTAAGATSGTQAGYVSSNPAAGVPPYNYTLANVDTLILARTLPVNIPVGQSCITLSFQWKCMGENDVSNNDLDNFKVYFIPKGGPITTNDIQNQYQVGSVWYNGSNVWNAETINLDPKFAGSGVNYTLAFVFSSNGSLGTQPPAAIDDVLLTRQAPTALPSCVTYTAPSNGATGLSPCNVALTWNHSLGCNGATSYQVYTSTAFGGPYTLIGTTSAGSYNLTVLAANTTYFWYIIPVNSFGANTAGCNFFRYSFTTGTNPIVSGVPPYFEDFEGCVNWTMYNGGLTNQWYIGNGTSAGGNRGMYVSNNAGASNTYTVTASSTTHAMSNTVIDLTGGGACINLAFSYRCAGEGGYDWLDVFAVPVSYVPTAGVAIPGGAVGGVLPNLSNPVRIAGPINGQSSYTTFTASLNALSGRQFRLVFSWRNDGSVGNQPPAAVDNISIISTGGPLNDAPCTATFIPPLSNAGLYLPGSNICGSNADEPSAPACWTNTGGVSQINTVWYRFRAPSSGCVRIRTERGSLYDTQIALYTRAPLVGVVPCGSGNTLTYVSCNDNRVSCGSSQYYNSEITQSGLSAGFDYYIAVDGKNGDVGTFTLFIMDGGAGCTNQYPPTPGADCSSPNIVCGSSISVPNPGYQGYGSLCDFSGGGGNCLFSGDRGGAWYQVNIIGPGTLNFDIVPNDYNGSTATDYDFAVWKMAGSGALATCASIANSGTQTQGQVRCNYSALGVTGCYNVGNSPAIYPGFNGAYETGIPVVAGETYYIFVSNYSNSTAGFALNFTYTTPSAAAVISSSVANGGTIIWSGTVSSSWTDPNNWGGCAIPSCSGGTGETDALIPALYVNPPVITGTVSCRSLTINPGATLTVNGTGVLEICKDYKNNGNFVAQAGSRVIFDGPAIGTYTGNQNIDGNLTGTNAFHHLDIFKASMANQVLANQDFDVRGNLKVGYNSGTSATNRLTNFLTQPSDNGKYVKVGGDFLVYQDAGGTAAFVTGGGSVLEFTGSANQNYMNRNVLGSVFVNQSAPSTVTVQPHGGSAFGHMTLSTSGTLTFATGKIVVNGSVNNTGVPATNKGYVEMQNPLPGTITGMNNTSYISGTGNAPAFYTLKKATTGAVGVYDLPVGTITKYSNLKLDAKTVLSPNPSYFLVGFDNTVPATNTAFTGSAIDECSVKYHSSGVNPLNNGLWRIITGSSAAGTAGVLDISLTENGYGNGANGQTVMYNKLGTPATAADWLLNPFPASACISGNSLPGPVSRTNMQWATIKPASVTTPLMFGTAQSPTPLPVEYLALTAKGVQNTIKVEWSTASEKNNKGYEVQRSTDGQMFENIGWVNGHGTTNLMNMYQYTDISVSKGITYFYRLKQIDYDGMFDISKKVAASISDNNLSFNVSPNPYSEQTNVVYQLDQTSEVTLEVFNKLGQKVTTLHKGIQEPGTYQYPFNAKQYGFSAGVYTVKMTINSQIFTRLLFENN